MLFQEYAFGNVMLEYLNVTALAANVTLGGGTELLDLLPFVGESDTLVVEIPGYTEPWYLFGELKLTELNTYSDGATSAIFRGDQLDRLSKAEFEAWADYQEVSGWKVRFEDAAQREEGEE